MVLQGFSHAGTEYACINGYGIFEGPTDDSAIQQMLYWKINAVRIPLNEHCWLGINGASGQYSGENYKRAIRDYAQRLNNHGIYVIVDLHWTLNGNSGQAKSQAPMANRDHSIDFWKSCASYFKDMNNVIFDLFNEPYLNFAMGDYEGAWRCWRDGGWCNGIGYEVAGMQALVNAVREVGSSNVVILGGLSYSNDLGKWLEYLPHDPQGQLGASAHLYNFNACSDWGCWKSTLNPIAEKYPFVVGEYGQNDCGDWYVRKIFDWFQAGAGGQQISHIAWTYNTWDCGSGPALITNYYGGCTGGFGCAVKSLYNQHPPSLINKNLTAY